MEMDDMASNTSGSGSSGPITAKDLMRAVAEQESAKAAEAMRRKKQEEEERKAIHESFMQPAERSDDEIMERVMLLCRNAAKSGHTHVLAFRFPSDLCTDGGRAINNSEPGWETSLAGRPKQAYDFWAKHLKPLGFKLGAEVLDYPGGMPGDIGFILNWRE
jgi:hypothetical protein